jgi:hypothetical protein|tara:strand:- start:349 stop:639 length:291 start_codon:yes stop_codon:yes gene_type:complete
MVKKAFQNPEGGLNKKGREHFKKKDGSNLRPPVKGTPPAGSKSLARKVSFGARWSGMKGAMKDEKGRPTRYALAGRAWGFPSREAARNFVEKHKKT